MMCKKFYDDRRDDRTTEKNFFSLEDGQNFFVKF